MIPLAKRETFLVTFLKLTGKLRNILGLNYEIK